MKNIFKLTLLTAGFLIIFSSCFKDLDTVPIDPDIVTADKVYDNPDAYKQVLAKLYAGLAVSGQEGPAGNGDISGIDEGFGQYLRGYWYMQELTTDEAVIAWNDQTIKDLHWQVWSPSDVFITAFYYRIFFQIAICNEFIRETTDEKLSDRGVSGQLLTDIGYFRAEARFLRALSYWHALDLFGNVPFVTEEDGVGSFFPEQTNRGSLFSYIESELKSIESIMKGAGQNEYGRADQAAVWALLAKLYLNAGVYIGQDKNTECLTYCNKILNSGVYSLSNEYSHLFMADNDRPVVRKEIIFPIRYDGVYTKTWGGTTFIISAGVGGDMQGSSSGIAGGWGGTRTTSALVAKFPDHTGEIDNRAMFFTEGQNLEIEDIASFNDGYAITKFTNKKSDGTNGSDQTHADTDFPVFRLADIYLMYAEAVLRGGSGGDLATAQSFIDELRARAGNAEAYNLDLQFVLDERARELYWEGHRRTDLVRYGYFSGGDYLWPWKGKVADGIATGSHLDLFPIPSSDIGANPNLSQNPGY
ncbi:MAG: RagB/SusD family nutrient uptake outer membrane protein [Bacteroidales bacterium]|nr:RagB/SusD family nutrient uptake outer membrane protein [Bacteroidales bacterium]